MTLARPAMLLAVAALLGAPLPSFAQGAAAEGERAFRTRCASCHSLDPGQNRAGPSLAGVVGRKAGSVEGARYSKALQESGVTWDAQSLDAFLADPRKTVPGTTMTVALRDAAQRAAIIAYLNGR
ncbi:c-type cytochrome [Inquilinus limosus]|uniref:c-type cytochrome n=1 Tax=Inquilinus limosus TaxID=171674 RepID=UPI000402C2BF|nr:c-type cytochrome [Inquilinus limosus]